AADGLPQPLLPRGVRAGVAERAAVSRRARRVERRAAALPAAPRRRRDPPVPAGVHAGPAASPLHAFRDPRADPRGRRPRHHVVGVVEPTQRVPAGITAAQEERPPPPRAPTL